MTPRFFAWLPVSLAALGGCVAHVHREQAALRMSWPSARGLEPAAAVQAALKSTAAPPSVSGDILHGTSPAELAAARAASSEALTRALAEP